MEKKWAAIKAAVGWLIMKKMNLSIHHLSSWITVIVFISQFFSPAPTLPKTSRQMAPVWRFFHKLTIDRKKTDTIQNRHLKFTLQVFRKKYGKTNNESIERLIYLYLYVYIYINIHQGFYRKRFIQISEVLSTSWSQKRIMTLMLPYI